MADLAAERSGILNSFLDGLAKCPTGQIPVPQAILDAVAEYRESEDDLGQFLSECTRDADDKYKEGKEVVFEAYQKWAERNGIARTLTMNQFTRQLKERPGWSLDPGRRAWIGKSVVKPTS